MSPFRYFSLLILASLLTASLLPASELHVGAATVDITPDGPVALAGQMHTRISQENATRIHAVALAVESRDSDHSLDHFISVSCDLVAIRAGVLEELRERLEGKLEGLDLNKLFLNATHSHTAPVTRESTNYEIPTEGVIQPAVYLDFLLSQLEVVITECWNNRQLSKMGYGQSQAVIAHNRRATYGDGTAKMYGATDDANFRGLEGHEDHNLDVLFFWDLNDQLIATAINVPCPAQEVEGLRVVHADFWHPVRLQLRERHGENLHIIAWTGAGGDVVPRPMYDRKADQRMRKLRNLDRLGEISRRIVTAWEDALEVAKLAPVADPVLKHEVKTLQLPLRAVTPEELSRAQSEIERVKDDPKQAWLRNWNKRVVDKHQAMSDGTAKPFDMELHSLRLGEVVIATNPFELFTAYGIQMKTRSPGIQTFIIQLAGPGSYLPTEIAVKGGGYSAVIQSSNVGPEGGQILVDETVAAWKKMWE